MLVFPLVGIAVSGRSKPVDEATLDAAAEVATEY